VEDCIQEVFINIIQNRKKLSKNVNIKLYLLKSLRLEIWRRLKREKKYLTIEEMEFTSDLHMEDKIINDEVTMIRVNEIRMELNLLPKRQKEAIYLRYYEGMSYTEISEVMNLEQSSSYKIIYKAIDALYQKLSSKKGKLFY
jgi:RNA polymerase sigma-70 factor (ECF subfamily)